MSADHPPPFSVVMEAAQDPMVLPFNRQRCFVCGTLQDTEKATTSRGTQNVCKDGVACCTRKNKARR